MNTTQKLSYFSLIKLKPDREEMATQGGAENMHPIIAVF